MCTACGWIYDEAEGFPDEDIDPGTPWGEVPDAFLCPDCGLGKELFRKLED
ncbi:MAG TPA: rubredoxin [Arenicellales bacterium]|nr:rubredoxin [Arenicellales bacterium]